VSAAALLLTAQPSLAQNSMQINANQSLGSVGVYRDEAGRRVSFVCPAGDGKTLGTVYGTDVYMDSSPICPAAIHAGVLKAGQTGVVTVVVGSGVESFKGSVRNGVTSHSYGRYRYSYTFARDGEAGTVTWRTTWNWNERPTADVATPITLSCPAGGTIDGLIYGTGIYAVGSAICVAAVHAGAITAEKGGFVTVTRVPATRDDPGSERFGIVSRRLSATADAFTVAPASGAGRLASAETRQIAGIPAAAPSATIITAPVATLSTSPPPASPQQQAPIAKTLGSAANSLPGLAPRGGLTAVPTSGGTAVTAVDPSNFTARQTANGTVVLSWSAVPGAGSYMLGGPGTNTGVIVTGTSHTLTGIAAGSHTWSVATMYEPGGILTTADKWSKTALTVVNTSGMYRVTITALLCAQPTRDTRSTLTLIPGQNLIATGDPDGPGDEILAAAFVRRFDRRSRQLVESETRQTVPYGDISSGQQRLQAGTQTSTGGIKAGDWIPGNASIARVAPATDSSFPLKVWEGRLTDGIDAVLVSPSVWEYDGGNGIRDKWAESQTLLNETIFSESVVQNRLTGQGLGYVEVGVTPYTLLSDADHDDPVGRRPGGSGSVLPNVTIVLTREIIERTLSSPWVTVMPTAVPGLMLNIAQPGILIVNFTDQVGDNPMPASYSMILHVEKVSE
jgi:hypothetical protein